MLSKGQIFTIDGWTVTIQVELFEELDEGNFRVLGKDINSRGIFDCIFSENQLKQIKIINNESKFTAAPDKVFIALESIRYRLVSIYDPLLAINTSKVDPLPHQIEAVYGKVLQLPRIRFLIADDPGAGKTIMAGLIIKELKLRQLINRVLIVVPGHLKDQWRRELKDRFEEQFVIVDRSVMDSYYGENVWNRENQIIASIDFSKRDDILPSLDATHFDLVIVDEAHKMSAYQYGNKTSKSKRYRLGEALSRIGEHLMFLTATPHKGDVDNFRLFLDLLEPGFFATNEMLMASIESKDNPLFIRRIKEDLKNFEGEPLFVPRNVSTRSYDLGVESPEEKLLYNELTDYVERQYNLALTRDKKRNIAFALIVLQRRFASSTYALLKSLERRKARLEELLRNFDNRNVQRTAEFDFETIEDMSEEERWEQEEMWETLSVSENRTELESEIQTLGNLHQRAKRIIDNQSEIKLRELKSVLDGLNKDYPGHKIIIFTESRDTLDYLQKRIHQWSYTSTCIHGRMKLEERIDTERRFKNEDEGIQVLVATEAAGEGINLQFCHLMINYDIPWNPNRLEQRMGRVHRYGQTREVFIYNLVARDTREGEVLYAIFEKLEEIRRAMGSDKVYDVISEVIEGRNLSQLLLDAVVRARSRDQILAELDIKVDKEYVTRVKENLGDSLATRFIDYTRIKELNDRARENRLIPEYTEAFFKKAFEKCGGVMGSKSTGFGSIDKVPHPLTVIAEEFNFKKKFGSVLKRYPKITFDKNVAQDNSDLEFISFGHPLFEAQMRWVEKEYVHLLQQGAVFIDPEGRMDGVIIYYEGEIRDGRNEVAGRRLFASYYDLKTQQFEPFHPSRIWDLSIPHQKAKADNPFDIDELKKRLIAHIIPSLRTYQDEISIERIRQAGIKEKYGVKSLETLILKLDGELIDYYARREAGQNMDLVIGNKEEQKRKYEDALKTLHQNIQKEKSLSLQTPHYLGAIRVVPLAHPDEEMVENPVVEKAGMDYVIEHELKKGRKPADVSAKDLGWDITSVADDGTIRRIEVKSRSATGKVALTINEMFKARRFKEEYYLYVVYHATTKPNLIIINNPAENLEAIEKEEVVRFIITQKEIENKGVRE